MRKITKGLAVLLAGALAAFAPAAAAQATGDKPKPKPRAELTSSAACTADGWRATFVLRNNAQRSFIEIVKVSGAVTALDPAAVAPGGTATASVDLSKQARFTGIEVEFKFVAPAPSPTPSTPDDTPTPPDDIPPSGGTEGGSPEQGVTTMTGTHPPKTHKLKTHVKRCACPWTPPTDNPSTPPTGGPSTPPSEDPDPSEEPSNPPSSNPPTSPPDDEEPSLPPTEDVGNKLPLTGAPVATLAVIAGVLIAGGGAALIVLRRRRERFEA